MKCAVCGAELVDDHGNQVIFVCLTCFSQLMPVPKKEYE